MTSARIAAICSAASAISGRMGGHADRQLDRPARTERSGPAPGWPRPRLVRRRRRPGRVRCDWRRRRRPWAEAPATSSGRRASSSPIRAAIRPSRPAPEACISSAPLAHQPERRQSRLSAPAATNALYWPIEWPAAKTGSGAAAPAIGLPGGPALAQGGKVGDRRRQQGRLGVLGQVQRLGRAFPGEPAERLAKGRRPAASLEDPAAAAGEAAPGPRPCRRSGTPGPGR